MGMTGDGKGEETMLRWASREDGIEDTIDEDLVDTWVWFVVGLEVDKKAVAGCEEEDAEEDAEEGVEVERWIVECDGNRRTGVKGVVEDVLDSDVFEE